ncbi:hypothetical protein B0H19DRAFT_1274425 [Mycena capillaripes]|nr:hypothetical protein B0H19DRAFT_1274425 [Mycena capillaripes]
MPRDTANDKSVEQFHQRLLSIGALEAEQLSVNDFSLWSRLVADCKAEAIRKAKEEWALEVERLQKEAELAQKKKEKLEKRAAKKRQEEEEKAAEKGKEKEAGPSGAGKRGRPIGPGGDSSNEDDEDEEELSRPKKKKAKKVDAGVEFPTKVRHSGRRGVCQAQQVDGGALEEERELMHGNQNHTEAAIGQLTAEVHTLARAVTELSRLAAAYTKVHHPDVVQAYHEDLNAEKKGKGKGKGKEPEVEDRGEGPSGSA